MSWSLFTDKVRLVAPIIMGATCVACHNTHPDSPKRDWKVGDVRGIQEITISQPIAANIFSFKYLLTYFLLVAAVGHRLRHPAAPAGGQHPRHEPRTRDEPTSSWPRSR